MKRIIALFLVLTTLFTLFSATISVDAAVNFNFSGFGFQLTNDKANYALTDKGLTLNATKEIATNVRSYTSAVPDKYDISFDLSVDSADQALFIAYLKTTRIYFSIRPTGFTFKSVPSDVSIGYKVGTGVHNYRLVGNGTSLRFFVDGYYISKVALHNVTDSPGLLFAAYSNDSSMKTATVNNLKIKAMDPSFEASINAAASQTTEESEDGETVVVEKKDPYNWPGAPTIPKTENPIYALARQAYPKDLKQYIVSLLPKEEVYHDFEGTIDDYLEWTNMASSCKIENGLYRLVTDEAIANDGFAMPDVENFTIEARIRYSNTAPRHHIYTMNNGIFVHMLYDGVKVENGKEELYSDIVDVGRDWHDWKFRFLNDGNNFEIYFDGQLILDGETEHSGGTHPGRDYYTIYKVNDPGEKFGIFEMDWRRYTPDLKASAAKLTAEIVMDSSEYIEGEDIAIRADSGGADIPAIRYMIDGQVVAVGKKEDDYKTTISGLNPGSYSVYAEYEGSTSKAVSFKVVSAVKGELKVSKPNGEKAAASLSLYDENSSVKSAEFFVDGKLVATKTQKPFSASVTLKKGVTHTVSAYAKSENGIILGEYFAPVYPDLSGNQTTTNYSNVVRYTVSGNSGTATVNVSNGTHKLLMKHTKDGFTYLSDEGEKTFKCGTGDFIIVTDIYAADVYYNGMLVESFSMPMTTEVVKKTTNNGLTIKNFTVTAPEERVTYFERTNVKDKKTYTEVPYLPHSYVADLVVGRNQNVRFYIKDGYFRTDVKIEDGKIYAIAKLRKMYQNELGSYFEDAAPTWRMTGELPKTEGDMLIRIETMGGISRIYANDLQIGVFRGVGIIGGTGVAFDIEDGSAIKKFTISDATDIYYYEDEFDGKSLYSTSDYWTSEGGSFLINEKSGDIILDSSKAGNAWATIDVVASKAVTSADIEIPRPEGAFWYVFSKQDTLGGFVGYNFKTKKFELGETVRGKTTKIAEVSGTLPVGKTVNWKIKTSRDAKTDLGFVELFIDGKKVISGHTTCQNNANLGFASKGNVAYIENMKYRGNSKPVLGLLNNTGCGGQLTRGFMTDEGTYFAVEGSGSSTYLFSNDGGKTFTTVPFDNHEKIKLFDSFVRLDNGDLIALDHGIYHPVAIEGGKSYQQYVYISKDDGKSWDFLSIVRPEKPTYTGMENRVYKTSTGRLINANADEYGLSGWTGEDYGTEAIYYSDDNGLTWKTTDIVRSQEIGMVLAESVALEMADGTVRMYFRSSPGSINYIDSHDNGATFDFSYIGSTPFESNVNCFNITQDPMDKNTLWAAWGYDWGNEGIPNSQWPRERYSVAVSYDGGETWEYVGTVKEVNYDAERHGLARANMMNAGIYVDDKAVYVRFLGSEESSSESQFLNYQFAIDKSKIVSTKSWEKLHFRSDFYQVEGAREFAINQERVDKTMLIGTETDNLFVAEEFYEGAAYKGNIQAEYAAKFVGADVEIKGNSVVLTRAGVETVFNGESVIKENGKTFIEAKAFAEKYNYKFYEEDGFRIITKFLGWRDTSHEVMVYTISDYIEPPLYEPEKKKDAWRAQLKELEEQEAAAEAENK